jgi:hypothetical protein
MPWGELLVELNALIGAVLPFLLGGLAVSRLGGAHGRAPSSQPDAWMME